MYRVILVDDEPYGCEDMKLLIDWDKYGFEIVDVCNGGEEALASIVNHAPHVVVTDIRMPGMDGLSLIEQVKAFEGIYIQPIFIVVSGYHDFQYARRALHMGVFQYLTKPIISEEADELLQRIREELDEREDILNRASKAYSIARTLEKDVHESDSCISLEVVEQYVRDHYREALTIKDIAERFHFHPVYLGQAFTKKYGVALNPFIHDLRIEEAAALLRNTELSSAAIAEAVGYVQYGRFIKQFMRRFGMKPSEYKQRYHSS